MNKNADFKKLAKSGARMSTICWIKKDILVLHYRFNNGKYSHKW
ncbi:hypothetical protein HMPREF0557_01113 [Listeria innocua ATCC 33091]|uniref:Uncharacterized protein n=1 Tax=Listeria innocua ATCC 33091 TaxID=1002366 RepID=A0AB72ZA23_LISIO|nr:hypothetical protein HMPREF0557_01113 [Listeria innocua ATCC 33091]